MNTVAESGGMARGDHIKAMESFLRNSKILDAGQGIDTTTNDTCH